MKLRIRHQTQYRYTDPLTYSVHNLLLWPAAGPTQSVLSWHIAAPAALYEVSDGWGNRCHSFSLLSSGDHAIFDLGIVASGVVSTHGNAVFVEPDTGPHPSLFLRSSALADAHPRITQWARSAVPALAHALDRGEPVGEHHVLALASAVADKVRYRSGRTDVETTALEAFDWGLGVCQDQAHVMLSACRGLGISARYVSGYFFADHEPELASHAWVDVCLDQRSRRWMSVDITHACATDDRYVRLAIGSDYHACPPIKGLRRGGGTESMGVSVNIDGLPEQECG